MAQPRRKPRIGMSVAEIVTALSALDAIPRIDRRVLEFEVICDGEIRVSAGHMSGFLNAEVTDLAITRGESGWSAKVVSRILS